MSSSDAAAASSSEISINVKGPSELKVTVNIALSKTVLDLKHAIAARSDVPADAQRLIYSGRVLKDDDALSQYKIQTSHTIHMVKGAPRAAPAPVPAQLPTMTAGQNPADPLTQLNGHMGHGLMAGFNPFADMGLNPGDPNMMQGMLDSPQFLAQMTQMMSNPAMLDQIIASNPEYAAMGPQLREMFQSEQFRAIVSNPEALRAMLTLSAAMRNGPGGSGAGAGAGAGAPPPGNLFGAAAAPRANPFANPFGLGGAGTWPGAAAAGATGGGAPAAAAPSAGTGGFGMVDPALMQQMLGGMGGAPGGAPWGAPVVPVPTDTRSPEERFQVQLQQLQDMGFTNASQNVRALLATAGRVDGAIEYILGGGGL